MNDGLGVGVRGMGGLDAMVLLSLASMRGGAVEKLQAKTAQALRGLIRLGFTYRVASKGDMKVWFIPWVWLSSQLTVRRAAEGRQRS